MKLKVTIEQEGATFSSEMTLEEGYEYLSPITAVALMAELMDKAALIEDGQRLRLLGDEDFEYND